ncbi:hypothetical protein DSO57_1032231 [Entomophthora muscae]|uniref:Uncharacterized protein n=1 Tax=Entomophthora muscae TaxID=34485 RepID=A0ACC2TBA4_9FUNG|nr:hypothetical protein DSO57_1032231 [Entomophthora muscae]
MFHTRSLPVSKPLHFANFQHRVFIEVKSALACTAASMRTVTPRPLKFSWFQLVPWIKSVPAKEKTLNSLVPQDMLVPLLKFATFPLAPVLVIIWTTFPDLWAQISSSVHYVGDNYTHFMQLFEDIPGRAQDLLVSRKKLVKSLTCDNLKLFHLDPVSLPPSKVNSPIPPLSLKPKYAASEEDLVPRSTLPGGPLGYLMVYS